MHIVVVTILAIAWVLFAWWVVTDTRGGDEG